MHHSKRPHHNSATPRQPLGLNRSLKEQLDSLKSSVTPASSPPRQSDTPPPPVQRLRSRQPDSRGTSVNTALADKLKFITFKALSFDSGSAGRLPSQPKAAPNPDGKTSADNYQRLLLKSAPTSREHLYVRISLQGKSYWYPIYSWISIRESWERFYSHRNFKDVRRETTAAIAMTIQSYLERYGLVTIPRSAMERAIRSRLSAAFPQQGASASSVGAKATTLTPMTKGAENARTHPVARGSAGAKSEHPPKRAYEDVIREYRARKAGAGSSFSAAKARLDRYLERKSNLQDSNAQSVLPGAFTRRTEGCRTVWVGLDFGTQNIKAMFRDEADDQDRAVVLEFRPDAVGIERFMFSPTLRVEGDHLLFIQDSKKPFPSWKHTLSFMFGRSFVDMDKPVDDWMRAAQAAEPSLSGMGAEDLAIFFSSVHLGWVLHRVGERIRAIYSALGIKDDLAFRVYMCAPASVIDGELGQVVFQDCLTMADQLNGCLEFSLDRIGLAEAFTAFRSVRCLQVLFEPRMKRRARVVPEVVAEIASYAQSRSAREGVYALVDIGAGTADLNIFRVVQETAESGKSTPVYASDCHPHGILRLESLVATAMANVSYDYSGIMEAQKRGRTFLDSMELAQQASDANVVCRSVDKARADYGRSLVEATTTTWGSAYKKKGRETAPWQSLTLFLCGGGAGLRNIAQTMKEGIPDEFLRLVSTERLPCPNRNEFERPVDFPESEFHRVAVAYGLTCGSDLNDTSMPDDIKPLALIREAEDIDDRFISKDMV